jgi:hypothetical protein
MCKSDWSGPSGGWHYICWLPNFNNCLCQKESSSLVIEICLLCWVCTFLMETMCFCWDDTLFIYMYVLKWSTPENELKNWGQHCLWILLVQLVVMQQETLQLAIFMKLLWTQIVSFLTTSVNIQAHELAITIRFLHMAHLVTLPDWKLISTAPSHVASSSSSSSIVTIPEWSHYRISTRALSRREKSERKNLWGRQDTPKTYG